MLDLTDPSEWIARQLDPALLMRDLGFEPDPFQERLLRSKSSRILLLCSRQLGKSTSTAVLALHEASFRPGSEVLLVSRSERQSTLLFRKVSEFYKRLRPVEAVKELSLSIEFANGSRIEALPGDEATIRGFSAPRMVILDEASRIPDGVVTAVLPMLVTNGGRLVALTTPFGKAGFFFEHFTGDDPQWERINARASESPRIPAAELAAQRRILGPRQYAQEFENMFLEETDQVFSSDAIDQIFAIDGPDVALSALDLEDV